MPLKNSFAFATTGTADASQYNLSLPGCQVEEQFLSVQDDLLNFAPMLGSGSPKSSIYATALIYFVINCL
jgi:hypothetical protein